jgi:hypothetical protein
MVVSSGLRSPRIKLAVASRFQPPPAIAEDDTDEQRHQQRAACHNKAHTHAPKPQPGPTGLILVSWP